ncbi:putative translation factor (SUA5) [Prochlorococcus sp. SS52]|nr:putative translation factor (SUA5) [Prochlorococcus marinus str. SS2]KGG22993.1 putative translation factor (SUA5) [Prochlorococcus marinus str. SS35]KGG37552.1 putative translation factor (SUA5) [Prochlorococcus sp. SS52]
MGSTTDQLLKYVLPVAIKDAIRMCSSYWPGALTIVLPASGEIVQSLNPSGDSIGIRIPACEVSMDFLNKSGPLATTSANLSGQETLIDPYELSQCFPKLPLLSPVPWPTSSGLASTLIKWKSPGKWQLLRRGAVIPKELY